MFSSLKTIYQITKETAVGWLDCNSPRLGASLAYYTMFAIAPLFLIALKISGIWFGEAAARNQLFGQLNGLVGAEGGKAIQSIVTSASNQPHAGWLATCLAAVTLAVATSAVFVELQDALNTIWKVERNPGHGIIHFIKDRLLSFAMILGIGFLLLVSLVVNAGLSAAGKLFHEYVHGEQLFWAIMNFGLSLAVITLLFAMIFKLLPDVKIAWRDVWVGSFVTALFFNLGKFLLGFYLGRSSVASAYGATGSLVIILMWIYYSAQILFFGAQFTRVYANRFGSRLEAVEGAHLQEPQTTEKPAAKPKAVRRK